MNTKNVTDKYLNDHLSEETLHALARHPESQDLRNARQHLLDCSECLSKLQLLQAMEALVIDNADLITSSSESSSLKSQFHAVSHEISIDESLRQQHAASNRKSERNSPSLWRHLREIFTINTPAFAIPGTAIASFMLAFVLFSTPSAEHTDVLSFQDSQVLVLNKKSTLPGVGFFHGAEKNEQLISDYAGFSIETNGSYLEIRWANVKDSKQYQLELFEISHNVSQSVQKHTTNSTVWQIDRKELKPGQLYRLSMSGNTKHNFHFRHMGGFVLR